MIRQRILRRYWLSGQGPGLGATLPSQPAWIVGGSAATSTCRATLYCNLNSLHLEATWEPLQAMLCYLHNL